MPIPACTPVSKKVTFWQKKALKGIPKWALSGFPFGKILIISTVIMEIAQKIKLPNLVNKTNIPVGGQPILVNFELPAKLLNNCRQIFQPRYIYLQDK